MALGMEDDSLLGTDGHGSFAQGFIVHRFTQIWSRWLGLLRINDG